MSEQRKSDNQTESTTSKINLVAAILSLISIVLAVVDKMRE